MNLLPFVFTFLLVLAMMSSLMFSSSVRITREKELLLSAHRTYLSLLSQQQKELYSQKRPRVKSEENGAKRQEPAAAYVPRENYREMQGASGSKLNLFAMIHGKNEEVGLFLAQALGRLIEDIYGACEFYKMAQRKDLASFFVQEMMQQKIKAFEHLKIADPKLDAIYYKMLKGTSSAYPPLTDYCIFGKETDPPIRFRFASAPVMEAALGKALAKRLFSLEKEVRQERRGVAVLNKKEFLDLLQEGGEGVPMHLVKAVFNFQNTRKGVAQVMKNAKGDVRVSHAVE